MATQEADELLALNFFDNHQVNIAIIEVCELAEALRGDLTVGRYGENADAHEVTFQNAPWAVLFQFCVTKNTPT